MLAEGIFYQLTLTLPESYASLAEKSPDAMPCIPTRGLIVQLSRLLIGEQPYSTGKACTWLIWNGTMKSDD